MRTVLIPTDFSKNANHAIEYALNLYKCERTNFYLLHSYSDEAYRTLHTNNDLQIDVIKTKLEKKYDKKLKERLQKIHDVHGNPKHDFEQVCAFEPLVDAVNDFVNKKNIDLVIMGTKGETADSKITFGSHTVQIFKYVQCPVLAVPEKCHHTHPKKILFATDYMLPYKRRELKLLNEIAADYKSEVHCLYISDFDDLSYRQIDNRRFLQETLYGAYLFFERTAVRNKTEAILDYIKMSGTNLLVMVNSRHSFIEDMLYRSTVDEIGLKIQIPFLVMQNLPR